MLQKTGTLTFLLLLPEIIFAHGSHGNGIMAGFTHPIFGLDHNVAILGTGILGYILGEKKWILAPVAFIVAMILGGVMGINQEATLFIEKTIAFSVLIIGTIIAFRLNINHALILILLALFGGFHGYAHGAEMDASNTALKYITGYALGAALLAVIGFFLGKGINARKENVSSVSIVGGVIIGCGIMMLIG